MKKIITSLQIIFEKPFYRWAAVITTLVFAYITYWLFFQVTTLPTYIENVKNGDFGRFSLLYGIVYAITTVLTVLLSGISVASALWLYQQTKERKKFLGANIGGLAAASLSVGCPV